VRTSGESPRNGVGCYVRAGGLFVRPTNHSTSFLRSCSRTRASGLQTRGGTRMRRAVCRVADVRAHAHERASAHRRWHKMELGRARGEAEHKASTSQTRRATRLPSARTTASRRPWPWRGTCSRVHQDYARQQPASRRCSPSPMQAVARAHVWVFFFLRGGEAQQAERRGSVRGSRTGSPL